jgi:hypothetical protein
MEEILRDLQRLSHRGAGLRHLFADVGQAAPARSQGSDRSGAVIAVLAPDGLPDTIRVHANWQDRLHAAAFAAAVGEACAVASFNRTTAWAEALDRSDWQQRLDELDRPKAAYPGPGPYPGVPGPIGGSMGSGPFEDLVENAIRALDAAMSRAVRVTQMPHGTGANGERTLTISLTQGGQVSCQADPRWVVRQTPMVLERALNAVLTSARRSLTGA